MDSEGSTQDELHASKTDNLFYLKLKWMSCKEASDREEFGKRITRLLNVTISMPVLQCPSCRQETYYLCDYCGRCPTRCCDCSVDTNPDWTHPGD
jgi:hypothetical protein